MTDETPISESSDILLKKSYRLAHREDAEGLVKNGLSLPSLVDNSFLKNTYFTVRDLNAPKTDAEKYEDCPPKPAVEVGLKFSF